MGYKIITYICDVNQIKHIRDARDTTPVWSQILRLYSRPHATTRSCLSQDGEAKFQVSGEITLIANAGMKSKDVKMAEAIIEENKENITNAWIRIHGKENH